MSDQQAVPVQQVQALAGQIAVVAAQALIQSRGDAANAIARLESTRGMLGVGVMADNGQGFQMDIAQAAQEAIERAAQVEETAE